MTAPVYRTAATRQSRTTSDVLHIAEFVQARRGLQSRYGTALCPVKVAMYPESGERGKPGSATCRRCIRAYRKITETQP
jgi:hypothetical protein